METFRQKVCVDQIIKVKLNQPYEPNWLVSD